MAGAAITIALQQLKGFLGIANFTKKSDIVSVMKSVWGNVHHGVRPSTVWILFTCLMKTTIFETEYLIQCMLVLFVAVELGDNTDRSILPGIPSGCQVHCKTIHYMFQDGKISSWFSFDCFDHTVSFNNSGEKE